MPLGVVMKGKDGVIQGYAGFLIVTPDFKIELKSWITPDKLFALEAIFSGHKEETSPICPQEGRASLIGYVVLENLKTAR
jgi:hypothetical protein